MNLNSTNITAVIAIAAIISPVLVQLIKCIFDGILKYKEYKLNELLRKEQKDREIRKDIEARHKEYEQHLLDFVSAVNECTVLYGNVLSTKDKITKQRKAINLGLVLLPHLQNKDQKIVLAIIENLNSYDLTFNDLHAQSKKINSEVLRLLNK